MFESFRPLLGVSISQCVANEHKKENRRFSFRPLLGVSISQYVLDHLNIDDFEDGFRPLLGVSISQSLSDTQAELEATVSVPSAVFLYLKLE